MPSGVVGWPEKWFSFHGSLVSMCRSAQTSTTTLRAWVPYVLLAGSSHMGHRIWGLLSSKLDNPTHKYSSHSALLLHLNHKKESMSKCHSAFQGTSGKRWNGFTSRGGVWSVLLIMRLWQNIRIPKGPLFYFPSAPHYHSHYHAYPVSPLLLLLLLFL